MIVNAALKLFVLSKDARASTCVLQFLPHSHPHSPNLARGVTSLDVTEAGANLAATRVVGARVAIEHLVVL